MTMYVSETENIWKERQEVHDANQRGLNSLQLELVKSDNELLYDYGTFFLKAMPFILRANWCEY